MIPPDKESIGMGISYLFKMFSPKKAANTSAPIEKRIARTAILRASAGSAFFVIFTKGAKYLKWSQHKEEQGENL